jgi:predicted SAM-dependent methyltransferase
VERRVLALGCGNQSYGTHRVDFSSTHTTTHVCDLERGLPFEDGFFDEVYSRNLLEHLQNHGFHLQETYRVLRKGGKVVLITDNAACMRYYLLGTHTGGYMGHRKFFTRDLKDKHYAVFTAEHLKNLFQAAGFKLQKVDFIDTDFLPTFLLDRVLRALHLFPSLTYPRLKVTAFK